MTSRWSLHFCPLDKECRRTIPGGPPWRIVLNTPWGHLGIALTPDNRYSRLADDGSFRSTWIHFRR